MRAILLAAGFGTRLRPLTDFLPKCLVPIRGRPLLDIWLDKLTREGFGPFLINTHYLSEKVEGFVKNSKYNELVEIKHETELSGTAGTLIGNLNFFGGEDGILLHADNYCEASLAHLVKAHAGRPNSCLMTMMTFKARYPRRAGILEVDSTGIVVGFHEKSETPPGNLANAAVYVLSTELLSILERDFLEARDFSTEVIPKLLGKIFAVPASGYVIDIGTPDAYAEANAHSIFHDK